MSDDPPPWFKKFMQQLVGAEEPEQTSKRPNDDAGPSTPSKSLKTSSKGTVPPKARGPPVPEDDTANNSEDEFDKRFGHLFNTDDTEHSNSDPIVNSPEETDDNNNVVINALEDEDDDNESVDEDLVEVLEKVPNWETNVSIKKFIVKVVDRPLPKQMLEDLSKDYTPSDLLQKYFLPPKMPPRLLKTINKMKNKNAIITERALYNAQEQQLIIAKPLVSALIDLKPLGPSVSKAREKMSVSLHGIFSVSLQLSHARRSNVRFLFKEALADVLYSYEPTYSSIFGGTDFSSQVEKAAKEAKLDHSWSKTKTVKQPPFRNKSGFPGSNNAGKYFYQRQNQRPRNHNPNYNPNYNSYNNNNNNKRYTNQKTRGSSSGSGRK